MELRPLVYVDLEEEERVKRDKKQKRADAGVKTMELRPLVYVDLEEEEGDMRDKKR